MKITVLTLFKEMYEGFLNTSIIKRIIDSGIAEVKLVDIREYSKEKHHNVDDTPYGGMAGMLMRVDIVRDAIDDNKGPNSKVLLTSPKAKPLTQADLEKLKDLDDIVIVCGHYEGIDARIEKYVDENVSIGDYILTGGELPSMVLIDGILRLLEDSISKESLKEESYTDGLLEYDQYTRPFEYDGEEVPFVLTNGNHKEIQRFNLKSSLKNTLLYRKDLLDKKKLTKEEKELLEEIKQEISINCK